jgi:signal recognition particle receptor subunit beta
MPVVNSLAREVVFKVVYYGPGLGGKTTSLQHVHATARPEHRGKMVSLATPVDRTLYFDFLPIRLPSVRGMGVRLQLFTVPGQVYYNATRKLVLTGVDGLVLVFDSQRARGDANAESLENLHENLRAHGRELAALPHVVQYNKRDIEDAVPIDELESLLNRHGAPSFGSVAMRGDGIYEALEAITRGVLENFQDRMPGEGGSALSLGLPEGGLADALRGADVAPRSFAPLEPMRPVQVDSLPSAELRLSELPEDDAGEAAARAVIVGPEREAAPTTEATLARHLAAVAPPSAPPLPPLSQPAGIGFELLWPLSERGLVREVEASLGAGDHARALAAVEGLIARSLAGAASALGTNDAPRDPATVALVLGIDGRRYLEFRSLAREARAGRGLTTVEVLSAYALAIQIRLARSSLSG